MIGRILLAWCLVLLAPSAQAAWDAGGGLENYRWVEYPENFNGQPRESGMRSALFVNWMQDGDSGFLLAWRAKLYGGTVNYDTYLISTGAPVSTKTDYSGAVSELQLNHRSDLGLYKLDFLGGLAADIWRRSIRNTGGNQIEDYVILFARAGVRLATARSMPGVHGEMGVKYPFSTSENAHLDSMGYTSNPSLSPKGAISAYAELGYRINARFDVVGYYDSWRFKRSDNVTVSDPSGLSYWVWQPESNMDAMGIKLLVSF